MTVAENPDETMYCLFRLKARSTQKWPALEKIMRQTCSILISNGVDLKTGFSNRLVGCKGPDVKIPDLFGFCAVSRKTVQKDVVQCLMKNTRLRVAVSNVKEELCQCHWTSNCSNKSIVSDLLYRGLQRPEFVGLNTLEITPPPSPDSGELQDVTPRKILQANALRQALVPKTPQFANRNQCLKSDPYHSGTAPKRFVPTAEIPAQREIPKENPAHPPMMHDRRIVNRPMPVLPSMVDILLQQQRDRRQQAIQVQANASRANQPQPPGRLFIVAPAVVRAAPSAVVENPEQLEQERRQQQEAAPVVRQGSKAAEPVQSLTEALRRQGTVERPMPENLVQQVMPQENPTHPHDRKLEKRPKKMPVVPPINIRHNQVQKKQQEEQETRAQDNVSQEIQTQPPKMYNIVALPGVSIAPSAVVNHPEQLEQEHRQRTASPDVIQEPLPAPTLPVENIVIPPLVTDVASTEPSVAKEIAQIRPKRTRRSTRLSSTPSTSQSPQPSPSSVNHVQPVLSTPVSTIEPLNELDSTVAPSSSGTPPIPMPTVEPTVSSGKRKRSLPCPETQESVELTPTGRPKRACNSKKSKEVVEAQKKAKVERNNSLAKDDARPVDGYHFLDYRTYFWKLYDPIKQKAKKRPTETDIANFKIEICKVCKTWVPRRMKLIHAKSHGDQKRYRCEHSYCDFQTEQHAKGRDHVNNAHCYEEKRTHVYDWARDIDFQVHGMRMLRRCFPKSPLERRPLRGYRHHMPFMHRGIEYEEGEIEEKEEDHEGELDYDEDEAEKNEDVDPFNEKEEADEDMENEHMDLPEDHQMNTGIDLSEYQDLSGQLYTWEIYEGAM